MNWNKGNIFKTPFCHKFNFNSYSSADNCLINLIWCKMQPKQQFYFTSLHELDV